MHTPPLSPSSSFSTPRQSSSTSTPSSQAPPHRTPQLRPSTPPFSEMSNMTPLPRAVTPPHQPIIPDGFVTPQRHPSGSEESQPTTPQHELHPRRTTRQPPQLLLHTNRTRNWAGVNAGLGFNRVNVLPFLRDEPYAGALAAIEPSPNPNHIQPNPRPTNIFATPEPSSNESTPPRPRRVERSDDSNGFTHGRFHLPDSPPQAQSGPRTLSGASAGAGNQTHTEPLNHSSQSTSRASVHERQDASVLAGESSQNRSLRRIQNSLQRTLHRSSLSAEKAEEIVRNFAKNSNANDETSSPDKTP